jgi:hypothetical protein
MQRPISYENTLGGINQAIDKRLIKTNEAVDAQNVNIDNGILERKNGCSLYTVVKLSAPIGTIMVYYKTQNYNL